MVANDAENNFLKNHYDKDIRRKNPCEIQTDKRRS